MLIYVIYYICTLYIYIYLCIYIYVYIYICIYIYIYIHKHTLDTRAHALSVGLVARTVGGEAVATQLRRLVDGGPRPKFPNAEVARFKGPDNPTCVILAKKLTTIAETVIG